MSYQMVRNIDLKKAFVFVLELMYEKVSPKKKTQSM